ncbi:hypothetical protein [Sulfuricurvum sp.]|uniref:hypothetical protein n=1 Tax=Sulfuricurvum sp. TaxID=2025608 RepID=UPI002E352A82|nr:hypothetical protein [Sulfuricurvum sp.]HEX5330635.1 hypothetical protein [Sulfuricurvum sp.]
MVKIFQVHDSVKDIVDEVERLGITGISGGRLEVRAKMKEIREYLINNDPDLTVDALSTLDHPSTELGVIFDTERYEREVANKEVSNSYI